MKPFNVLFDRNDEIEYKGKIISKYFKINRPGDYRIKFTFIKSNSQFNQAIVIFFNDFSGNFFLEEQKYSLPKSRFPKVNYWLDTAPNAFEVRVQFFGGHLLICNGSDPLGNKQVCHSLYFGCAIFIEQIGENKYRFNCNDHENDDDFDDLIFEMEIINENTISDR